MHELVLDQAVRDWVLIPLTLSVVLMMVLRQYISKVSAATWHRSGRFRVAFTFASHWCR